MDNRLKPFFILLCILSLAVSCEKVKPEILVLYDFESESVLGDFHWKCHTLFSLSSQHAVQGKKSLKLELFPSSYPGLSPALKFHDWRPYQSLCFEVYNPSSETIRLVLRVDDKKEANDYTDRYNKSFMLLPGANALNIPLSSLKTSGNARPLNLKNIYRFLVFLSHPREKHILYLDYFRLE